MSQGRVPSESESLTPVIPEQDYHELPEAPVVVRRQGAKEPVSGSRRAREVLSHVLEESSGEGEGRHDSYEPVLEDYFDSFGTDLHRRIALCRAYASYLAAQVGIQRRKPRVVKKIRYGLGHDE